MLALVAALAGAPAWPGASGPSRIATLNLRSGAAELTTREVALHGLPVRGAYETEQRRGQGAAVRIASRLPSLAPRRHPREARIDAAAARAIVRESAGVEPSGATLVYVLVLGAPVLAWEVALPLRLDPTPSLRTIWLGARSGRVVLQRDAAWASDARVYPSNPSTTPEPIDVELTTLDVTEAGLPMSSVGLEVRGCGAASPDPPPPWWTPGGCLPVARALSDLGGDYLAPLPNIGLIADNRAFDDTYAEIAAYRYVEQFFDVMHARGLVGTRCERFTVLVNRHTVGEDGALGSSGGASYVDTCNADVSPTLLVGQGKDVDFAYDADVLFHEMGHSVVQQLSPDGLADRRLAPWGMVSEAGAINEGLADYFAMTVSGDPEVAEYIGRFDVVSGSPYLRTGDNTARCPDDLQGEWHTDGRIVAGTMWSIRSRLGVVVDELVLRTLPRLPPDAVLSEFGVAARDVAHEMFAEGTLDANALALVERSVAARGLLECDHVIADPELATNGKRMHLLPTDGVIVPFAPGPFQLRVQVPDDATEVTLFATLTAEDDEQATASFLVKRADAPVSFAFEMNEGTGDDDERILVTGDWDVELQPEALNDQDFIARLPVTPGEVLHVALANRSETKVSASNFFVAPSLVDDDDGCACGTTPGHHAAAWSGTVLLLLGLRRRRR